jgi:hypothetical protein
MAELTEAELHERLDRIEDRLEHLIEELVTFLAEVKQGRRGRPDIDRPRTDLDPERPGKARPTREEEARPTPEEGADARGQPPPPTKTFESLPTDPHTRAG